MANISPRYRSTHLASYLVAVGKSEDISHYGIDKFLSPFVDDLKSLYLDGVSISESIAFRGALLAFLGDNLASHLIGGFKEGISFALRICRSCMITSEQSQEITAERDCTLRTPESHEHHCFLLDGPLRSHFSTTYGVNRRSILEDVPGFSVVKCLPHDIMHDLFEGVVKKELSLFLTYSTTQRYFSIEELNQRISYYDFMSSKPSLIYTKPQANEYKIRQSASQMISLSKELPLLVGDKIPTDDQHYYCFLLLLKICAIVLSPVVSRDTTAYLQILTEEKISLFKEVYPLSTVIPKMHYMVHYATQLKMFGPLVNTWTMRQEAKLSFIKRSSQRGNFKNVPKTVAKAHQLWLSYKLECCKSVLTVEPEFGKAVETMLITEPEDVQKEFECALERERESEGERHNKIITGNTVITHHKWMRIQNTTYKKGMFILLKYDDINPVFGIILEILALETIAIFHVNLYHTDYFDAHFNSFVIVPLSSILYINVNDLAIHECMFSHRSFDQANHNIYVSLPYTISAR